MDIGTIIGLAVALGGVLMGYILDEGDVMSLIQHPSPMLIVFGGTLGALMVTFPISEIKRIPEAIKLVFFTKKQDIIEIVNELASLSEKARKEGLLSLEQDVQNNKNEFMRKGLGFVVDGIEADAIRDILDREIQLRHGKYESLAKMFEAAGGFSPTMGVLGTVMGMVSILGTMEENPGGLGEKIATAFIATMFGVGTANIVWLPFAGKIKAKAEQDTMVYEIIVEGLLSIQAGENPKLIKEKLNVEYLERESGKSKGKGAEAAEGKAEG